MAGISVNNDDKALFSIKEADQDEIPASSREMLPTKVIGTGSVQ